MPRRALLLRGLVQGLGFRPAVAIAARRLGLTGRVMNAPSGARIEIQGDQEAIDRFLAGFDSFLPPGAVVEELQSSELPLEAGEAGFLIGPSSSEGLSRFSVPPDLALCPECRREFRDPRDRRYRFPFISCGSCGPRYTYMSGLPYDRANTTMADFPLCPSCRAEYEDPGDRRYHIEGFCCPDCGPRLEGLEAGIEALLAGGVALIKGIGGYHLACLADLPEALTKLRGVKRRPTKPLAVMYPSIEELEARARLLREEREALLSSEAPIVLLPKARFTEEPPEALAPGNPSLGAFLPYSPLHELLLSRLGRPIALTSANSGGDPLLIDDAEARAAFAGKADALIAHGRRILQRADDGVVFAAAGRLLRVRNGRGSAPRPIRLASSSPRGILALGAELKSTVSVASGRDLATSPHIGDLESLPSFEHFRKVAREMLEYYSVEPELVVVDLHPDYESTRFGRELARERGIGLVAVQHHYAHFLSVLLDAGKLEERGPWLGLILDGTGYGLDGEIWGGELILGDASGFERLGHLAPLPLPGGEAAVREPWRIAAALGLAPAGGWGRPKEELERIRRIAADQALSPPASSCGRLFDAAAAILGFDGKVSFEGEAAIWLEALASKAREPEKLGPLEGLEGRSLLARLASRAEGLGDRRGETEGSSRASLALGFHEALAAGLVEAAASAGARYAIEEIVLSGGVFQNRLFLGTMTDGLAARGLRPIIGGRVPLNDGGISVGQAAFALGGSAGPR